MKLSDVKGDRVIDVIADVIEPISNIAQDKAVIEMLRKEANDNGEVKNPTMLHIAAKLPKVLKHHKADVIAILAAVNGVTAEDYAAELTMGRLVKDVYDLLTDRSFSDFFKSAQLPGDENASGSAPENTTEAEK